MRRVLNGLVVLCLVTALTAAPAYASPRRDDGDGFLQSPIKRIAQIIKRVVKALDGGDMSIPKP